MADIEWTESDVESRNDKNDIIFENEIEDNDQEEETDISGTEYQEENENESETEMVDIGDSEVDLDDDEGNVIEDNEEQDRNPFDMQNDMQKSIVYINGAYLKIIELTRDNPLEEYRYDSQAHKLLMSIQKLIMQ